MHLELEGYVLEVGATVQRLERKGKFNENNPYKMVQL